MTVFASVKRFCAIEGVNCEKSIPYQGSWTYFFAYPSTEPWRDCSALLANDLESRGIYGRRWRDVVNNDLLFSKVCEGIYGHDFLLAEVRAWPVRSPALAVAPSPRTRPPAAAR